MKTYTVLTILVLLLNVACITEKEPSIESGGVALSFNNQLYTKVDYKSAEEPLIEGFQPSEILKINGEILSDFEKKKHSRESINDEIGTGSRLIISGEINQSPYKFRKTVTATVYDNIPDLIITQVEYENLGDEPVEIQGWENNRYIVREIQQEGSEENFWSFQSGSYPSRQDWVLPVGNDFYQQNYQGMNSSDYGGGIPLVDVWRSDAGLAVGHSDLEPQLVSLPVHSKNLETSVQISVVFDADSVSNQKMDKNLEAGESFSTLETFVTVHNGDFFSSIEKYRTLLQGKGVHFSKAPDTAYEPIWCAWGYERNFTVDQVVNTLPKVKELGFEWAVLDDGWQIAEGDWRTNQKFADVTMKEFVDQIHDQGLKAKLWWAPLAADPGSDIHENQPDMLLVNKGGDYQRITWWNSHYLNPALNSTKEYHKQLVEKFINEWGYDGLKIDGQHLNQVPPDYGHENSQKYPEKSVEELPDLYKVIYETALSIKPDAVVEICPCGTSISSFITPFMNQSVSSDPLNSWQIRLKGKTYKALMGRDAAYYGDHVELSDNRSDFASTVGIGGVIGTKFTWPEGADPEGKHVLTAEKEALVSKWMDVYKTNMLPKGNYRGELYDIGFDYPEAHAIEKDGSMYYAFYSDSFNGSIDLRGLDESLNYELVNYETGETIGEVEKSKTHTIQTQLDDYLLIKAQPISSI